MDLDIARILEGILALQLEIGDLTLERMKESIVDIVHLHIGKTNILTMPKSLDSIGHFRLFDSKVFELSKSLWRVDEAVRNTEITTVPHRGSIGGGEVAFQALDILALPEDVHAVEAAVDGFDASRLFEP